MDKSIKLLFCATLIFSTTTYAQTTAQPWLAFELGMNPKASFSRTTSEPMPNKLTATPSALFDDYTYTSRTANTSMSFGAGYYLALQPKTAADKINWLPALNVGVWYQYDTNAKAKGQVFINQQSPAALDSQFRINTQSLWLTSQLDLFTLNNTSPYIELGLGLAQNKTSRYAESTLMDNITTPSADFSGKTTTNVTWRAGLGVSYQLPWQGWHVNLAYRYSDLGKAKTKGSQQYPTATNALSVPLQNSTFLLGLRYQFNR